MSTSRSAPSLHWREIMLVGPVTTIQWFITVTTTITTQLRFFPQQRQIVPSHESANPEYVREWNWIVLKVIRGTCIASYLPFSIWEDEHQFDICFKVRQFNFHWEYKFAFTYYEVSSATSVRDYPARALRALGPLLADGAPTVGGGKTFLRVSQIFLWKQL